MTVIFRKPSDPDLCDTRKAFALQILEVLRVLPCRLRPDADELTEDLVRMGVEFPGLPDDADQARRMIRQGIFDLAQLGELLTRTTFDLPQQRVDSAP